MKDLLLRRPDPLLRTSYGSRPARDPAMVAREVYNRGKEEITFRNTHWSAEIRARSYWHPVRERFLPPEEWSVIVCKPGEWVFLPHAYYTPSVPSGSQEIPVLVNYGRAMHRGNRLPSAPGARVKYWPGT